MHYSAIASSSLQYSVMACSSLHYSVMTCSNLHYSVMVFSSLYYFVKACSSLHYSVMACSSLYYFVKACSSLHYSVMACSSQHCSVMSCSSSLALQTKHICITSTLAQHYINVIQMFWIFWGWTFLWWPALFLPLAQYVQFSTSAFCDPPPRPRSPSVPQYTQIKERAHGIWPIREIVISKRGSNVSYDLAANWPPWRSQQGDLLSRRSGRKPSENEANNCNNKLCE